MRLRRAHREVQAYVGRRGKEIHRGSISIHCLRKRLAEIPSGVLSLPLGKGKVVQCLGH
jgi:hypothetical protein